MRVSRSLVRRQSVRPVMAALAGCKPAIIGFAQSQGQGRHASLVDPPPPRRYSWPLMANTNARSASKKIALGPRTESLVREALEAAGCRYTAQRAAVFGHLE